MKEGHCGACLVIPLNFWVKPLVIRIPTRIVTGCTIECRYTYQQIQVLLGYRYYYYRYTTRYHYPDCYIIHYYH